MDISRAIEHARVHDQLLPWVVDVENTIEAGVADTLREKGHNVTGAPGAGTELICEVTCLTTLLLVVSDILLSYAAVQGVMRTQDGQITGKPWSLPHNVWFVTLPTYSCAPQLQVILVNMAWLLATKRIECKHQLNHAMNERHAYTHSEPVG